MAGSGRVVAVIPARGGSKGVPGKNLALVGGRPLLTRAIAAAQHAIVVDQVIVSTDDEAIAGAARAAGATVIIRPADLATDSSSSELALLHALAELDRSDAEPVAVVVLVQCTSPFLTATDIDAVAAPVRRGAADSAFSAAATHGFIWRPDGSGINHDPAARPRRQDREPELLETGAAYAMTAAGLRLHGHRFFGRIAPVIVDAARTLEIDEPGDLERARRLAPLYDDIDDGWPSRGDLDAVVLDFDGTLTDDRVTVDQDGRESVTVHRGDGLGVAALRRAGLQVLILSSEQNPVVTARARKLGVPALQGVATKGLALASWCAERQIPLDRTLYLGNDVNDLPCLDLVGWPTAVGDAHHSIRAHARLVTAAFGGNGAVREVASRLLGKEIRDGFESPSLHR
jgi:YrbI family 3-deoxy-D-manno-octulosonate 8-phosphate phosphatase